MVIHSLSRSFVLGAMEGEDVTEKFIGGLPPHRTEVKYENSGPSSDEPSSPGKKIFTRLRVQAIGDFSVESYLKMKLFSFAGWLFCILSLSRA